MKPPVVTTCHQGSMAVVAVMCILLSLWLRLCISAWLMRLGARSLTRSDGHIFQAWYFWDKCLKSDYFESMKSWNPTIVQPPNFLYKLLQLGCDKSYVLCLLAACGFAFSFTVQMTSLTLRWSYIWSWCYCSGCRCDRSVLIPRDADQGSPRLAAGRRQVSAGHSAACPLPLPQVWPLPQCAAVPQHWQPCHPGQSELVGKKSQWNMLIMGRKVSEICWWWRKVSGNMLMEKKSQWNMLMEKKNQ